MKDINEVLLNPIRSRIIQYLARNQKATAGDISSLMTDIPKTTLYRHLKILYKHKIIMVVEENRVRGSVERTYSLNLKTIDEKNTKENALGNAFGFLMKIYGDFDRYFSEENKKPSADKIFLSNVSLLMNDDEFDELFKKINGLLAEHLNNKPNKERKQRSLSFISSPCKKES
jgi:DNA-binding transcriptional ArsR family regulator